MKRIVMLGPPGVGKGTQAKRLCRALGLVHLSSGDILRAERKKGSPLGEQVKQYMDAGKLVPDEIITRVMVVAVGEEAGYVLDGFPRTLAQARSLDEALVEAGIPIETVLDLTAPANILEMRLTGRRLCSQCGKIYHLETMPPQQEGRCDTCQTELIQRTDDTAAVVRERIEAYESLTAPLTEYYRQRGVLVAFDGNQPADEVARAIESAVKTV